MIKSKISTTKKNQIMKRNVLVLAALFIAMGAWAQESPRKQAEGQIAKVSIAVDYGSPSVKGRAIWGELEPYGKIWRAGANENTTISFDADVKINGDALAAGKYGFFIIPNENGEWVAIFNRRNADWGGYSYDMKEDALRVTLKPKFVDDNQESLIYTVERSGIVLAWEKARLTIPVSK
jgi:hypothetical protein